MLNKSGLFGKKEDTAVRPELTKNPYSSTPQSSSPTNLQSAQPLPQRTEPMSQTASTAASTSAAEQSQGSKLIVGPNIKLKGVEITDCDTLVVEGRVEATMDSRVIQIADHGDFKGTVGIDIAEIRGHFEGELTARQRLVIYSTGSVSGKIRYGKIVVEEGGELSGDVMSLSAEKSSAGKSFGGSAAAEKKPNELWVAADADKSKSAVNG